MASDGNVSSAGESDANARRIADLSRKLDEVAAATSSAKMAGRVMTVLILLSAIFGVVSVLLPFYRVSERKEEISQALIKEFQESIQPKLVAEIQDSLAKTGPVVQRMVLEKAKARGPEVAEAIDVETKAFMETMKTQGQAMWTTHVANLNEQIYSRLAERVPELADKDKAEVAIKNAHEATKAAVERLVAEYLKDHIESITSIQEELAKFPVPSQIKNMKDEELRESFMDLLASYSTSTLKAGLSPQTREFFSNLGDEKTASEDSAEKGN